MNILLLPRAGVLLLGFVFAVSLTAQGADHVEHRFEDANRWAQVFENPERDEWQKPDEVIRALALRPDAVVTDVGSGTGYFAVRLARAVPRGRVLGVDVEPDMVRYLNERARREGLSNLSSHLGARDAIRACWSRSTWC
jgi:tRNA G46 methylase TrmB